MKRHGYPDDVVREVAKNLYRLQNFKAGAVCREFKQSYYQDSSLKAMLSLLRKYLNTGKRDTKRVSKVFYTTINNCIDNNAEILIPSNRDAARNFIRKSKNNPRSVISSRVSTTPRTTPVQNYKIALQVDDMIKICPNQSYMDGYMDAFKQMERQLGQTLNFKQIKINILE